MTGMATQQNDVELPPVPVVARGAIVSRPIFARLNSRKRSARSDDFVDDEALSVSLHTSSDPALFSSDETPDADNYANGKRRKKKTYAGTWWGERFGGVSTSSRASSRSSVSQRRSKRKFERNFDSGIFMNSDDGSSGAEFSSDSSFGNDLLDAQRQEAQEEGPRTPVRAVQNSSRTSSPKTPRTVRKIALQQSRNQDVIDIVRACLEANKEDVDLSGMALNELPYELRELTTMIKEDPGTGIEFDSLVARPRLYLANNIFHDFPIPILDVGNLRLLSLRQNKLTSIPRGIRQLKKLEVLNIAGNRLTKLPYEILKLMRENRLQSLLCHPNPFQEATAQEMANARTCASGRIELAGKATPASAPHLAATSQGPCQSVAVPTRVASLVENVLRQLSKLNNSKRNLTDLMANDTPQSVRKMLTELHTAQQEGDRYCCRCQRLHVQSSQTWLEWWSLPEIGVRANAYQVVTTEAIPFEVEVCGTCEEES